MITLSTIKRYECEIVLWFCASFDNTEIGELEDGRQDSMGCLLPSAIDS